MRVILMVLALSAFLACKKNSDDLRLGLIGKWKLSEWYADPGDGSGTWQHADPSNPQFLEFTASGKLIFSPSNVYLADHYKVTSDSTMIFSHGSESYNIRYMLGESLLAIYPPCIEGCGDKYVPADR